MQLQHANLARLQSDLRYAGAMRLAATHQRLDSLDARLRALDPSQVLARGFAWLSDDAGKAVTSARQIRTGQTLQAVLRDGSADVVVEQVRSRTMA